jgi:acyl-coenzyme A synthetase/AMP-(fatty) acid ligase
MREEPRQVAAILCHAPAAFARAHLAALCAGSVSVLVPNQDYRVLADLARRFGPRFEVFTDRPDDRRLQGHAVRAVTDLSTTNKFPQDIPPGQIVTVLLTSGTTGEAKLVTKAFGNFAAEVRSLDQLFRAAGGDIRVITTVPFEHMYGYVYGFFWPRLVGLEAPEVRVALPSDLVSALSGSSKPVWLVTTPIHLAAFVEAGLRIDNVDRVFSATGPLSPKLARDSAECFGAPITDIYGSTETGTVAWRDMDGSDTLWQCLPLRQLHQANDGSVEVHSPDYPRPEMLADVIELATPRQFRVVGRAADLIKVAGKRTSLAGLNAALLSAPSVRDGIYWMPEQASRESKVVRPVAFVVLREGATTEAVIEHLRGRIDPVFLPRPLFTVDDLNRNAVGKLPKEMLRALYASCVSTATAETAAGIGKQAK